MTQVWNFDETQVTEFAFEPIPVGDHRVRIADVIPETSKNTGKDMWKVILDVSEHSEKLFYYLVFMPDKPEITNTNLASIFSSFEIKKGDLNLQNWLGKVGACHVKQEMYNGNPSSKVNYFIKKENQDCIPPWQEKATSVKQMMKQQGEDKIPF